MPLEWKSDIVATSAAHAYAPSAIKYATLDEVLSFFQDSSDAEFLKSRPRLGRWINPDESDTTDDEEETYIEEKYKPKKVRYKGQIGYKGLYVDLSNASQCSDNTRAKIFIAALFLMDRLAPRLAKVNLTIYSRTLRKLTKDLGLKASNDFDGVNVESLLTLYFQIVNARRCLDAHLAVSTPVSFTPTHMFKIAGRLVAYDNVIQKATEARMANKTRKATKEKNEARRSTYSFQSPPIQRIPSTGSAKSDTSTCVPQSPTSTGPSARPDFSGDHGRLEREVSRIQTQLADLTSTVKAQQATIEALELDLSKSKQTQSFLTHCL
ncbi:hypothetical protein BG003_008824 [Podila horticola]|nr:hypothetical protein BG003_008824 [Podila horticola]